MDDFDKWLRASRSSGLPSGYFDRARVRVWLWILAAAAVLLGVIVAIDLGGLYAWHRLMS